MKVRLTMFDSYLSDLMSDLITGSATPEEALLEIAQIADQAASEGEPS